jgi:hypothetical protein
MVATRCDLHRNLFFDGWHIIREVLVSFKAGSIDYECIFAQYLNYDVISVILEFLSDNTISIQGYDKGFLFNPTRNCSGVPITKWECRRFARSLDIGMIFISNREAINLEASMELLAQRRLYFQSQGKI